MEAVNPMTRKAVFDTLCDLEWHIRYCSAMADRNHLYHRVVRFGLLLGGAIEGGLLYGGTLNPWLFVPSIFVGLALACLTIWDSTSDYATNAATLRMVVIICQKLRFETERLWRDTDSGFGPPLRLRRPLFQYMGVGATLRSPSPWK